ncbi:DUF502 domain-containing protein [Thiococcus pfennigii]|uniref:DUF502 domain-containing protein n=1 Tax=Thiococcus pfennigii TaxID=1057 RepID=UPI0019088A3B|nr:DUF502 domain-containing protein [Thiococcus pfennigii]MBK1701304.1 hypothetical protein [Thiococcus pfennigii]
MAYKTRRYILTGVLTVIPILVTVFVFRFFVDLLSDIGRPKVALLANGVRPFSPELARLIVEVPWLSSGLAIALTLVLFYVLGWATSRVVGRRIIHSLERQLGRIPIVTTVYGATKKLIDAFQGGDPRAQKVVLIEFPRPGMKTVGFVTHAMFDRATGKELSAVYVPTAPNPTSGYLEIVPSEDLIRLDWSVDEAMTFVVSGGVTAPPDIPFSGPTAVRSARGDEAMRSAAPSDGAEP